LFFITHKYLTLNIAGHYAPLKYLCAFPPFSPRNIAIFPYNVFQKKKKITNTVKVFLFLKDIAAWKANKNAAFIVFSLLTFAVLSRLRKSTLVKIGPSLSRLLLH
jgi:hypothetical protein